MSKQKRHLKGRPVSFRDLLSFHFSVLRVLAAESAMLQKLQLFLDFLLVLDLKTSFTYETII